MLNACHSCRLGPPNTLCKLNHVAANPSGSGLLFLTIVGTGVKPMADSYADGLRVVRQRNG